MIYQVDVSTLKNVCNPMNNPWTGRKISFKEISNAIERREFLDKPYSEANTCWKRKHHINRIAYLAANGWNDSIDIDVGVPHMGYENEWLVTDGNHRLAASIFLNQTHIQATFSGCCDTILEMFGIETEDEV